MEINFWEAFFGVNANRENRYINQMRRLFPTANQLWGVKTAVWIDTQNAWELFMSIPELRAVIDKRASMMSAGKPVMVDKNGALVQKHWLLDLIAKPNPMQSWADVVYSLSVNDALYSNSFAYSPLRSFNQRNIFVTLPSGKIEISTTGRTLKQMDAEGLISGFRFKYDNEGFENLEVQDVVYLTTADGMNIIKPTSKIDALKYPLSNIKASYHKRNVLLENIGAIGILSAQKSDIGGSIPMTPEEKQEIQRDWYNRSKDELIITESQVNWQPMSYPTRDLMLFEELTADKLAIIDAYGLNYNLFSSDKGATFTNVRDSIRMCYTDTIIPETQSMYDTIMQQFKLTEQGYKLIADFSHLPVLQDDELSKQQAMSAKVNNYSVMLRDGVITSEQYAAEFGIELMKIDAATAQAAGLAQAQTQLRGTVGGLDGIISLNTAVSAGQMERQTAINTLVNYYGYSEAIAAAMITAPPAQQITG
jgi:hypothetical protein